MEIPTITLDLKTEGAAQLSEFSGPFSLSIQWCERLVLELSKLPSLDDSNPEEARYYANGKVILNNKIVAQVEFL